MLQIFSIALAQVEAGNTSENLQNDNIFLIYFLYQARKDLSIYYTWKI